MFYIKGIDITNDKQMFNFLKNHFEYCTMNSWNRGMSIANNVKIYNLGLSGDCWNAINLLHEGEYDTINEMIQDWESENSGYKVFFNGRSGGYLVLTSINSCCHVLPYYILENDTYEDYKEYCRENYGSVKANRCFLAYYTKLIQSFDRLCDQLRDYCDELSRLKFEVVEMQKAVAEFNSRYDDDLAYLDFDYLTCDGEGKVNIEEIRALESLFEAFIRLADRSSVGYTIKIDNDFKVYLANC